MSGELVTAVLSEAWHKFGGFPVEQQAEIALWVRRRCEAIKRGDNSEAPASKPKMLRSWYEKPDVVVQTDFLREPGDET